MIDKLIDLAIAYAPTVNLIVTWILIQWPSRARTPF